MKFLKNSQRDAIGLTFVLNDMQADSPYGAHLIRQIDFFAPEQKQALLDEFHNTAQFLTYSEVHSENLNKLRRLLMRFKDITNILKRLEVSTLQEIELFELKGFMLNLKKLNVAMLASATDLDLIGIEFLEMEHALNILDPEKKRLAPFYLGEYYSKELWDVRQQKNDVEERMRKETDKAVLDALKDQRLRIVAQEYKAEMTVKEDLSKKLRVFLADFRQNIDTIGKLDFTIQKALLARRYEAVSPEIGGSKLELHDMINPAIDTLLKQKGKAFTPVSVEINSGVTILTGANMGGKSVAIRTMVLNVCLGHMGLFVFAKKASIPLFDSIYLLSEDLQSVDNGLSTFGAEVICLSDIVRQARTSFSFIALDELARGTNPQEGALIVRATAKYLNNLQSMTIMTTHYDIASGDLSAHYQIGGLKDVDFAQLSERVDTGAANGVTLIAEHMDYRLYRINGRIEPARDALNICKLLGLDREILSAIEAAMTETALEENAVEDA